MAQKQEQQQAGGRLKRPRVRQNGGEDLYRGIGGGGGCAVGKQGAQPVKLHRRQPCRRECRLRRVAARQAQQREGGIP